MKRKFEVLRATLLAASFVAAPVRAGWIDAATGQAVKTNPFTGDLPGTAGEGGQYTSTGKSPGAMDIGDPNHAFLPRTGQNLFWKPCPPTTATSSTPPVRTATYSGLHTSAPVNGPYIGLGGSYFFEPGTHVGILEGVGGYRFGLLELELRGGVGLTTDTRDNGISRTSTKIDWTVMGDVLLDFMPNSAIDPFFGAGVGIDHIKVDFLNSQFSTRSTEGVGVLIGGIEVDIGDGNALRAEYNRLQFFNGSGANKVGLTFIHRFASTR